MSAAVTDDKQIIQGIVDWAKREGKVPGQNRIMAEYSIGKSRVVRLLAAVDQRVAEDRYQTGPVCSTGPTKRPDSVRSTEVVRTEETNHDRTVPGPDAAGSGPDHKWTGVTPAQTPPTGPDRDATQPIPVVTDRSGPGSVQTITGSTGPDQTDTSTTVTGPVQQVVKDDRSEDQANPVRTDANTGPDRSEHADRTDRDNTPRVDSWRPAVHLGLRWAAGAGLVMLLGYGIADTTVGRHVAAWVAGLGLHRVIVILGVAAGAAVAATAVTIARQQIQRGGRWSTRVFLAGALIGLVVSGDTSWRFFQLRAHISDVGERIALFAGVEVVLLACGVAMYEQAKEGKGPGNARWLAWALSGVSGYAALTLDGFPAGPFRLAAGPVLAVLALHMAMGIEIRHSGKKTRGEVWTKVVAEIRERWLSRLGLGDDNRDAITRTRHRAAIRAARLAYNKKALLRESRLRRALVRAAAADDPDMRRVVERHLAVLKHSQALTNLAWKSPWEAETTVQDSEGGN